MDSLELIPGNKEMIKQTEVLKSITQSLKIMFSTWKY